MRTPQEIAAEVVDGFQMEMAEKSGGEVERVDIDTLKSLISIAIHADRDQPERDGTIHAATIDILESRLDFAPENETETRAARDAMAWIEQFPDEFWDRFAGPMLDEIEQAARNEELYEEDTE